MVVAGKIMDYKKKVDIFLFRLSCDLADHTVKFNQAREKKDIFNIDKEIDFIKYIEKLIIKAKKDLS